MATINQKHKIDIFNLFASLDYYRSTINDAIYKQHLVNASSSITILDLSNNKINTHNLRYLYIALPETNITEFIPYINRILRMIYF